ncbi:MAG: replication initiator protein [Microvirus sp.]|nr:MAG: replication initiator protein [Microvirus sp.]
MPCFHPLQAFQRVTAGPNGKREVIFSQTVAATFPTTPLTLPCGRCVGCRLDRAKAWALRCAHEATLWPCSSFLTLTYAPEHLPQGGSLVKRDFQLFMKRLRKHLNKRVSYYMCGEYGTKGDRPHYHAILFGEDFLFDRVVISRKRGVTLYRSPTLDSLWGLGFASIGNVTFQSAAYVARYCMKKITGEDAEAHYRRVDTDTGEVYQLLPEFNQMSLKPGIGQGWFEAYSADVYPDDFIVIEGKRVRSPKYYDRLLERSNPDLLERVKRARKARAKLMSSDSTPERLRAREICLQAKVSKLTRGIE